MPVVTNIPVTPGTGLTLDAVVGANSALREITCLGDPSTAANYAGVNALSALQVDLLSSGGTLLGANKGIPMAVTPDGATLVVQRTPSIFKTGTLTASGNTAIWTPASGKKFRLMRFMLMMPHDTTTAGGGEIDITFNDSGTALGIGLTVLVNNAGGTNDGNVFDPEWIDLGNGYLSAAANNVLNLNMSLALSGGKLRWTVCGTEE